ncbi:MAG TPA: hypothetical protein VF550_20975 [Polyangia bacterium]
MNSWASFGAMALDKIVFCALLAIIVYFLNRRLERFKLRQTALREHMKTRAEIIRGLLREMQVYSFAIAELCVEIESNGGMPRAPAARKEAVNLALKKILCEIVAARPWIGDQLAMRMSEFGEIGRKVLERQLQGGDVTELEAQMEDAQSLLVAAAVEAMEIK